MGASVGPPARCIRPIYPYAIIASYIGRGNTALAVEYTPAQAPSAPID